MLSLTIFTPTYNRKHTIVRTYESLQRQTCKDFQWLIIDDGSSDGTRDWVETLGNKELKDGQEFDWMGLPTGKYSNDHFSIITDEELRIEYIYKPNGGLYTGYNVAYASIQTELCVCVDSDDFMPDDAVEKISKLWYKYYPDGSLISNLSPLTSIEYCGIEGLDFDFNTNKPIGGYFPDNLSEIYRHDLALKKIHFGDTKQVLRTDLMRVVSPQIGFKGEKNFNPIYMISQVTDEYPILIINDNLCVVEYQIGADSMSGAIFKQYVSSPRSLAKMRLMELSLKRNTTRDRFRSAIHLISSCIIAGGLNPFKDNPQKTLTFIAIPFGILLSLFIIYKSKK